MDSIKLWQNTPPCHEDGFEIPTITYYPPEAKPTGAAVIALPGGGYDHRALHEGEGYCKWLY